MHGLGWPNATERPLASHSPAQLKETELQQSEYYRAKYVMHTGCMRAGGA
jgi:hypothetical protein